MKKILLIGGGGQCKSAIDIIEQEGRFSIAGIIDKPSLLGKRILSYKVIGTDDDLKDLNKVYKYALVTVGHINSASLRIKLFEAVKSYGYKCPVIVSPRAYVSLHSKIGEGTIIMHDVLINSDVTIGENCIINNKALIEHETIISNHCHISTGSIINGNVKVGQGSFVGSSAIIVQSKKLNENSFVKAGEVYK